MGNVSDLLAGFHPEAAQIQTENLSDEQSLDYFGHTQVLSTDGNSIIDFGPGRRGDIWGVGRGRNNWTSYASGGEFSQVIDIPNNVFKEGIIIKGLNFKTLQRIGNRLNNSPGFYNIAFRSCSSVAARALTLSGVPMLGFHPYVLQAQAYLWEYGLRPWSFCYFIH